MKKSHKRKLINELIVNESANWLKRLKELGLKKDDVLKDSLTLLKLHMEFVPFKNLRETMYRIFNALAIKSSHFIKMHPELSVTHTYLEATFVSEISKMVFSPDQPGIPPVFRLLRIAKITLTAQQYRIFTMRYLLGLSYKEIFVKFNPNRTLASVNQNETACLRKELQRAKENLLNEYNLILIYSK